LPQQATRERRADRRIPNSADHATAQLAARDAIRRGVMKAIEASKDMVEAVLSGDQMALSNAGFVLSEKLEHLWGLREHREPNWGDLVNLIQSSLVRERFELFGVVRCKLIGEILGYHLRPSPVEDDDLRSSVRILRRAELDPWVGLSPIEDATNQREED